MQKANIIFFYGPPATAKSYVAQQVAKQTGYVYFNLDEFYAKVKAQTEVDKLNKLMQVFQAEPKNYVVDGFLDKKAQAVVFFEHYQKPRYVVYFQSSKDEVEQNIRLLSTEEQKKSRFQRFSSFLQNRDELLAYLKKFQFFVTVDAVQKGLSNNFQQSSDLIIQSIMSFLKPKVLVALTYNNEELAEVYLSKLETELGFKHLHLETLCEEELAKGTPQGKQMGAFLNSGQVVPPQMQIELLRKYLYNDPQQNKFVLTSFPEKYQEFRTFEDKLFPITGLINFLKEGKAVSFSAKINPVLHYSAEGKNLIIQNEDLGPFQSYLTKRVKYGIVIGPAMSGKTTFAKYISQKFGFNLIEWGETAITQLKEKLSTVPGEQIEELTLPMIIKYYKDLFSNVTNEKYVFDGFPPGCEKPEQILQFLNLGQASWVLNIGLDQTNQWIRYKIKSEIDAAQEMTDDDKEKMITNAKAHEEIVKQAQVYVQSQADCKLFKQDTNYSLEQNLKSIDQIFGKRVYLASILANLDSDIYEALKLIYINIAAKYRMAFVDVEQLIAKNFEKLSNDYEMRWTKQNCKNPSNFTPETVMKLVKQYIDDLPIQSRDVLLWGYISADQQGDKQQQEQIFPRATDELMMVEKSLGQIKVLYAITEQPLNPEINDPEWVLEKPEVPPPKQEGDGGDDEPKDGGNADGEENVPKFNIYNYQWTKSEVPKNMAQIFMKVKQPSPVQLEVSDYSFKLIYDNFEELFQSIQENNNHTYYAQIQLQQPVMD
ncbi:unnamed protein product [Paramecium octaurelia]|uniref:Adenylate kinase n=1 Tax=Paramecium octaurelia TaxID=43137 RepID=A0A8S1SHG6_PAROT|nr:unnamed protein product [Paramecium octaurelia]